MLLSNLVIEYNPCEKSRAAERLQEALQKSRKRAGCSSSKFRMFNAAMESPMTVINSAVVAEQNIRESRSALQSGFEKTKNVATGNGLALVSTKKKQRNAGFNNSRHSKNH